MIKKRFNKKIHFNFVMCHLKLNEYKGQSTLKIKQKSD